ncbi:MAG: phosphoribosylaminoimidazolesuccinocarboxamide synthase [bacterium]|nr:phosphoribosylaminoimidazolesuccinocarboxamide synthase [bacterium]
MNNVLCSSEELGLKPTYKGKVRDLFDLGDKLLIVATDRISAYDVIMNEAVPGKGAMLTKISVEWFRKLDGIVRHHLITADWREFPEPFNQEELADRSMLVHKTDRFDLECVVRGYLVGSGWKDYGNTGAVCGIHLPNDLIEADKLEPAIFTPATKEDDGHDINVGPADAKKVVGEEWFDILKAKSLELYKFAEEYARSVGIIIADTKLEFGVYEGELMLIDEVFTPDSSRFWAASSYRPGATPDSYDKQILRKFLDDQGWGREGTPPTLPPELVTRIYNRYAEIFEILFPGVGGR